MQWLKLLFYLLLTSFFYILFYELFGKEISVYSFAFSFIIIHCFECFIFLPLKTLKEYSPERIDFNIKISGLKTNSYKHNLTFKIFIVTLLLCSLFIFNFKSYLTESLLDIVHFFQPTQAFLTIDSQAVEGENSSVAELSAKPQSIVFNALSYLKIKVVPAKNHEVWTLFLQDESKNFQEEFILSNLNSEALGHYAGNILYDKFKSHKINLTLTNGKRSFSAALNIKPIVLPIVSIEQQAVKISQNMTGKLAFSVDVTSAIPLTKVVLLTRTQSGFKYEQVIGEFANNNLKNVRIPYTEVNTVGFPFAQEDIIFVKAVAKTPFIEQTGESKELQFNVQSPIQIKKQIIKNLELTRSLLESAHNFTEEEKNSIQTPLFQAMQLALSLNSNRFMTKKISEINTSIQAIEKKKDDFYKASQKQITSLLKILKRQIEEQKIQDLIYKIKVLAQNISADSEQKINLNEFIAVSDALDKSAQDSIEYLHSAAKELNAALTKEEKTQIKKLFAQDITKKSLQETTISLKQNNGLDAKLNSSLAYESARFNIAGIMQILKLARKKQMDKESQEDEENSEKEMQQEEDMRNYRSNMETVAAQSFLDESWRKNILNDIMRLKKEGSIENQQMIDYLESRLR